MDMSKVRDAINLIRGRVNNNECLSPADVDRILALLTEALRYEVK